MSRPLLALLTFSLATPLFAQPLKVESKLKIGESAPPLVVDKWLTSKEVKGFEKDTVYVLSFLNLNDPFLTFGTVALSELHDKSRAKGVTVVGVVSSIGQDPTDQQLEAWNRVVKLIGISYPVAWEAGRKLADAYLSEANQGTAVVIDKTGKVAFVGPEANAAVVTEKILDGSWKGQADIDAMAEALANLEKFVMGLGKISGSPDKFDDEVAVKKLQGELPVLEKIYQDAPFLQSDGRGWGMRLLVHLMAQSYDVCEEMVASQIAVAKKRKSSKLLGAFMGPLGVQPKAVRSNPKLVQVVTRFVDAYVELLDPKKASTEEYAEWLLVIQLSTQYGNQDRADTLLKLVLDSFPAEQREKIEKGIKEFLRSTLRSDK